MSLPVSLQFDPTIYEQKLDAISESREARRWQMKVVAVASAALSVFATCAAFATREGATFAAYAVIGSVSVATVAFYVSLFALGVILVAGAVRLASNPVASQYEVPRAEVRKNLDWEARGYVDMFAPCLTQEGEMVPGAYFPMLAHLLRANAEIPDLFFVGRSGERASYESLPQPVQVFLMNFGENVQGNRHLRWADFSQIKMDREQFLAFLAQLNRPLPLKRLILPVFETPVDEDFETKVCRAIVEILWNNRSLKTLATPSSWTEYTCSEKMKDHLKRMFEAFFDGETDLREFRLGSSPEVKALEDENRPFLHMTESVWQFKRPFVGVLAEVLSTNLKTRQLEPRAFFGPLRDLDNHVRIVTLPSLTVPEGFDPNSLVKSLIKFLERHHYLESVEGEVGSFEFSKGAIAEIKYALAKHRHLMAFTWGNIVFRRLDPEIEGAFKIFLSSLGNVTLRLELFWSTLNGLSQHVHYLRIPQLSIPEGYDPENLVQPFIDFLAAHPSLEWVEGGANFPKFSADSQGRIRAACASLPFFSELRLGEFHVLSKPPSWRENETQIMDAWPDARFGHVHLEPDKFFGFLGKLDESVVDLELPTLDLPEGYNLDDLVAPFLRFLEGRPNLKSVVGQTESLEFSSDAGGRIHAGYAEHSKLERLRWGNLAVANN